MKINNIWLVALVFIGLTACDSEEHLLAYPLEEADTSQTPVGNFTSGTADFSSFVALGNSLTAGYSDGALFAKGQEVSFPNILAQRFALAGGGPFTQPLMSDDVGGLLIGGAPLYGPRLIFDAVNQSPIPASGSPSTDITNVNPGPYNNMGVPGAKSYHLLAPGYGDAGNLPSAANPYFVRMASDANASVLDDAMGLNPTFFSLWIGNNDVLGYATSGGDGTNPITGQALFDGAMDALVATLTSNDANGIISNIPSVTDAPFFTTVPHNPIPLDEATAGFLNSAAAYGAYNAGLLQVEGLGFITPDERAARTVTFAAGAGNAVVIIDESLTDLTGINPALVNMRQATADDLIILPASSFIGTEAVPGNPATVNGVAIPLADKWVLIPSEQTEISDATTAFNQKIGDLATQFDLALFDVNTFFNEVATSGFQAGSAFMTADYVTGGTFSLDGVHPSPRGYAVVANQMIDIINTKYGATIPKVNPVDYTGVYLD